MSFLPVAACVSVSATVAFPRDRVHAIGTVLPGFSRLTAVGTFDAVISTALIRPVSATSVALGAPSAPSRIRNSPSAAADAPRTSMLPSGAWATLE
ncbi:hypothetical protein ABZY68_07110 [Streptomyces sp. NPDC006482]|uniref:hypothetical protein n=1 Tax=Streptomyces sp. NPDC006482 TaxID=3154306 RepID=UPI0033A0685A